MKRIKYLIIIMALFIRINVNGANINLDCPNTASSGDTITCQVNVENNDISIKKVNADYLLDKASFLSFDLNSDYNYQYDSKKLTLDNIGIDSNLGSINILIEGRSGEVATFGLNNITLIDKDNKTININDIKTNISILSKTVPTTKKTTKTLYLDNITIDGYDISFNKSTFNYTLNVGYEVTMINVLASSNNDYKISGTGKIHLNEGSNDINIKVKNDDGDTTIYTININRIVKTSNIVNNDLNEITEAFKSNKELIINLDIGDEAKIQKEIIDLIKGKNRKLTYNINQDNETLYSYIFDGSKFNDFNSDIDLKVAINIIDDNIKSNIKDKKLIYFTNNYKNSFPTGTLFKIKNLNSYHNETRVRLYKVKNDYKLDLLKSNIKIKDNYIEFELKKGDSYILSNKLSKEKKKIVTTIIIIIIIILELIIMYYLILIRKEQINVPEIKEYMEKDEYKKEEEKINN